VVALGRGGGANDAQDVDSESGPPRNRTANPLIKRCDEGEPVTPHDSLSGIDLDELE